mmetsp:Transcript_15698/g.34889  ORF Transcript_15698/g.34889 Transcript_15698/m.34889 type:complete len:354 (+) Transcript_15698:135-1196(+)
MSGESDDESDAVVVHCGSFQTLAGFAGNDSPTVVMQTIVGRGLNDVALVGCDALRKQRGRWAISRPIQGGVVQDWDDLERVWHHLFYSELRVRPEDTPVLVTEVPLCPKHQREELVRVLIEDFDVPSVFLCSRSVLALYASGRTTGLVVSVGHTVSHTVPVYEGFALPHATMVAEMGGRDADAALVRLCRLQGEDAEWIRNVKHAVVAVVEEGEVGDSIELAAPGGTMVLGPDRNLAAAGLLQPGIYGKDCPGLHHLAQQSVQRADPELMPELVRSVVLAGGGTMFRGLDTRLKKELEHLWSQQVNVIAAPERRSSQWIGGSIFASLNGTRHMRVTRALLKKYGPEVVHRMCF